MQSTLINFYFFVLILLYLFCHETKLKSLPFFTFIYSSPHFTFQSRIQNLILFVIVFYFLLILNFSTFFLFNLHFCCTLQHFSYFLLYFVHNWHQPITFPISVLCMCIEFAFLLNLTISVFLHQFRQQFHQFSSLFCSMNPSQLAYIFSPCQPSHSKIFNTQKYTCQILICLLTPTIK